MVKLEREEKEPGGTLLRETTGDEQRKLLRSTIPLYSSDINHYSRIACSIMALQQLTGVTFSSSYGPTFYKSVGLADKAFVYAVRIHMCYS